MGKCKCGCKPRIISNVCQNMQGCEKCCLDVCSNPIIGDPKNLGIMAPLIYDEIGVNLCATFNVRRDISTDFPGATRATVSIYNAIYDYAENGVRIERINGRENCSVVTLSNITIQFMITFYDCCCKNLGSTVASAIYLPADPGEATYDEDTNPSSVELELFTPYGFSYDTTGAAPTPIINFVGYTNDNNQVRQGVNLFANAKLLDLDIAEDEVTVGVTLVLQSLYFVGYKVHSMGKIDIPKGSIVNPDNSDCRKFVAGELLNLAIKPLDLGWPHKEEEYKKDCEEETGCGVEDPTPATT